MKEGCRPLTPTVRQQVPHRIPSMSATCQALGNAQRGTSTNAIINPQFIEEETEAWSIYVLAWATQV